MVEFVVEGVWQSAYLGTVAMDELWSISLFSAIIVPTFWIWMGEDEVVLFSCIAPVTSVVGMDCEDVDGTKTTGGIL